MAAKPKPEWPRWKSTAVPRRDFDRMVEVCENAPPAGARLRNFVAAGQKLVKSNH